MHQQNTPERQWCIHIVHAPSCIFYFQKYKIFIWKIALLVGFVFVWPFLQLILIHILKTVFNCNDNWHQWLLSIVKSTTWSKTMYFPVVTDNKQLLFINFYCRKNVIQGNGKAVLLLLIASKGLSYFPSFLLKRET